MRLSGTLRKNKKNFIIYTILWLISVIVFVMPVGIAMVEANLGVTFDFEKFFSITIEYVQKPFLSFEKIFKDVYFQKFIDILWKYSLVFFIVVVIGTIRNQSKSEYENIEHGSSDWSKGGEQYKILSNKKGIILAEDHYLPVDKRGNVNVLVVGRFWFW